MWRLDLSWPEVTLILVIVVFGAALFRPEILPIVADFFSGIGHLFSYLNPLG